MFKPFQSMVTGIAPILCGVAGSVMLLHSSPVLADEEPGIELCMDTFWHLYEEVMRTELDARFDVVECGKDGNMPYVLIGLTLLACEDALSQQTNFFVRGPEPKSYLPEYKIEKECSIQGPISCGDEWIVGTVIDIPLGGHGALGEWKKFVRNDVCEMAMADYLNDQRE